MDMYPVKDIVAMNTLKHEIERGWPIRNRRTVHRRIHLLRPCATCGQLCVIVPHDRPEDLGRLLTIRCWPCIEQSPEYAWLTSVSEDDALWWEDPEQAAEDCGYVPGLDACEDAGTEHCEFDCPFRAGLLGER